MSLEMLLLGVLREPASGYRINGDFEARFGSFWSAELSQIYRTLKSLEKKGYLKSRMETSDRGPAQKVYHRTPAGHSRLLRWLAEEPAMSEGRVPYLAQLSFLDEIDDLGRTLEVLTSVRDHQAARLAILEAEPPDEELHRELVRQHGRARARALLEWAEASIAKVEAHRRRRARRRRG